VTDIAEKVAKVIFRGKLFDDMEDNVKGCLFDLVREGLKSLTPSDLAALADSMGKITNETLTECGAINHYSDEHEHADADHRDWYESVIEAGRIKPGEETADDLRS